IQSACAAVLARAAHCADAHDARGYTDLFAPDARWSRPGMVMQGHAEIHAFMRDRSPSNVTRHVNGSVWVEVIDADHARSQSYAVVYRDPAWSGSGPARLTGPEIVADYRDTFRRIAGEWKIQTRDTVVP